MPDQRTWSWTAAPCPLGEGLPWRQMLAPPRFKTVDHLGAMKNTGAQMSNEKHPGWLGYIGDYNEPLLKWLLGDL